LGVIDAILSDDKQRPVKQRHTAKRIFEQLKEEHQFTSGYMILKGYVRGEQLRTQDGSGTGPRAPVGSRAIDRCPWAGQGA